MNFRDFISEGVTPSKTTFGTDLEDMDFNVNMDGVMYTFFISEKYYYYVAYNQYNNEFAFGASDTFSNNIEDYSTSRKITKNAQSVFSKVFYIFLIMAKKFHIKKVKFTSNKSDLGSVYEKLSKNKLFLNNMEKNGFKYDGKENGFFVYSK